VTPVTRIIRDLSEDQPVERAATLEDVRAEVLTPDRLNTLVFGGFAAVALVIAVVASRVVLLFSSADVRRELVFAWLSDASHAISSQASSLKAHHGRSRYRRGAAGGFALPAWLAAISRTCRSQVPSASGLSHRATRRRGYRFGPGGSPCRPRRRDASIRSD